MDKLTDMLILFSFLVEAGVLVYLERRIWNTLFTPLVFMILPYTLVLLVTVGVSGNMGFVQFYYPSILFWSVGSIIFFIPSLIWGNFYIQKLGNPTFQYHDEFAMSSAFMWIVRIIALLFIYRFWSVSGSSESLIGSDDFGEDFAGGGFFGHLRVFTCLLVMLLIYKYDSKHKFYLFYVFIFLLVGLFYQVKGWIIIPCIAGISARLITGKLKLRFKLILRTFVVAFLLFQVSYILAFTIGGEDEVSWHMMEWIAKHFFHYLTSGTFGLSMDMERGFPDCRDFEILISPFYNFYAATFNEELVKPINPIYYNPGLSLTNVRTIFGTIFINGSIFITLLYTFILAFWIYGQMVLSILSKNAMFLLCFLFSCSLLAFGWFDFYFSSLEIIEIPCYFFLIYILSKVKMRIK